jgi:nucleoside-diphosphate-sugar epimerase
MQTILGANGAIGSEMAPLLLNYTDKVRIAGRNPKPINAGDDIMVTDVLDAGQTAMAIAGSDVVYLLVGLQYDIRVWQDAWPRVMSNVINGCRKHGARLVFFDNVYMYGKVNGWMTEDTPYNPCSRKGEVRAAIATHLMEEAAAGNVNALIARSADFYGPLAYNTFLHPMVFQKLKSGKSASWLCNDNLRHSFTYTPDAGKATAVLGNTPDAFGRVWHLPTDHNPLTGKEFIWNVAHEFGTSPKYSVMKTWMMRMGGLFNKLAKESVEMAYQYEKEYLFDSTKFEKRFFAATSYQEGIKQCVSAF